MQVAPATRQEIKPVIEANHYSKSINGVMSSFCFKLVQNNEIIGGMIYGKPAMRNQWKKYCSNEDDLIELRRLAIIDDTPKNTESFFIGKTLRWLKQNTRLKIVLSYADPNYGHEGIIYKATNFKFMGLTQSTKVIMLNGKKYHDKSLRTKYNGVLKPFAIRLKAELDTGNAKYVSQKGKNIYLFKLR